jgi:hypothetical protein
VSRLLLTIPVVLALLLATACGDVSVRGAIGTSTFQGTVSSVQVQVNGGTQFTLVTFEQNGSPVTFSFCGDQTGLFDVNQTVTVNFNPGLTCATVVSVVIVI